VIKNGVLWGRTTTWVPCIISATATAMNFGSVKSHHKNPFKGSKEKCAKVWIRRAVKRSPSCSA